MRGNICKNLATLGPVGYFPAPGTCGTLVTVGALFLVWYLCGIHMLSAVFVGCLLITGLGIIHGALAQYAFASNHYQLTQREKMYRGDPREIVLDEVIGMAVTMWNIPLTPLSLVVGFVLFRFFDIVKPCGISMFEKLPGAWGIVADDVAAGMVSNLILWYLM